MRCPQIIGDMNMSNFLPIASLFLGMLTILSSAPSYAVTANGWSAVV